MTRDARYYSSGCRPGQALTEREREVMRMLCDGLTYKEVGAALSITKKTTEKHVAHLYAKCGVGCVVHLLHYAIAHGHYVIPPARKEVAHA